MNEAMMNERARERKRRHDAELAVRVDMAAITAATLAGLRDSDVNDYATSRLDALAARHHLSRFGFVGDVVDYDPVRHEIMGGLVQVGTPVRIEQVGFTFAWGDVSGRVIHRARVTVA